MRLIQHKREAYWFYRFLSLWYDRWVNPLFWTPAMRALALEQARLERGLKVLDAGAGTGFTRSTPNRYVGRLSETSPPDRRMGVFSPWGSYGSGQPAALG